MKLIAIILALIVSAEHFYILILEMFLGQTKKASRTFNMSLTTLKQKEIKTLLANQGLYNGFLAAGIIFGLFIVPKNAQLPVTLFFLGCVIVAALYGALTSSKKILLMQGLPAILAFLACIYFL